jgi:hypothetical protein
MALPHAPQTQPAQLAGWRTRLSNFAGDEIGADEGMNKLLIFALVALPLLALLIFFGNETVTFVRQVWDEVFGGGGVQRTTK